MSDHNVAERRYETLDEYLERQFRSLHERLSNMESSIAGLAADEATLATVIPELATQLGGLHETLTTREQELQSEIAKEGQDQETITRLQGELAQVQTIAAALHPLVEQAASLVPAPVEPTGGQPSGSLPPGEGGV